MKLHVDCNDCKAEITHRTWSTNRVDLKMKHGDNLTLKCKSCNKTDTYSINDLRAKESKIALLIGLIVFLLGTPIIFVLLWDYLMASGFYGGYTVVGLFSIITVPLSIYIMISKNDEKRVRIFNRS